MDKTAEKADPEQIKKEVDEKTGEVGEKVKEIEGDAEKQVETAKEKLADTQSQAFSLLSSAAVAVATLAVLSF